MNAREFATIITVLEKGFPMFKISNDKDKMTTWFECLNDLPPKETMTAIKSIVMTSKNNPTIALIRETVLDIAQPQMTGAEALSLVLKNIDSWDPYKGFERMGTQDKLTGEIAKALGMEVLMQHPGYWQTHFIKLYNEARKRELFKAFYQKMLNEKY